jgi:predicted phosphodiesterase
MKIAIISDVHSNFQALTEVKKQIEKEKVDRVICIGDIVGYGGNPRECIAGVKELSTKTVRGNHEDLLPEINGRANQEISRASLISLKVTREMITEDEVNFLSNLDLKAKSDDGLISMIHGSFFSIWKYIFNSKDAILAINALKTPLGFVGHSHVPFVFQNHIFMTGNNLVDKTFSIDLLFERFLANPGSVGQPRDGDNRASFGLLSLNEEKTQAEFKIVRVDYDIKKAGEAILAAGMPPRNAERLFNGE